MYIVSKWNNNWGDDLEYREELFTSKKDAVMCARKYGLPMCAISKR